jgi:hypothetical protein
MQLGKALTFSSAREPAPSSALLLALSLLTVLSAVYFVWPVWRAFLPLEIDGNEGWSAYFADAVMAGRPLYGADPLVTNNWPPLSFYLIGGISAMTFDGLYVGRALSLLSIPSTALAIALCIRSLGGSRLASFVGAVWFIATMARFFDNYVGMNDPHLVALSITSFALVWLLRLYAAGRAVEPAILLMVLAGFYKHNLFAIPVTAICWLALHDLRRALRAALVGCAAVALGLVACRLMFGEPFFHEMLLPRNLMLQRALGGLGRLQWIAPAFILTAVWAWYQRQTEAARMVALFATIAFAFYFLQKLGDGVADNAQFELTVATAIGTGLAFENVAAIPATRLWGIDRGRLIVVLLLIARLLLSLRMSPYLLLTSGEFRESLHRDAEVARSEINRVAVIPGEVSCSVLVICRWAGKAFVFDAFTLRQRILTGSLTQEQVDRLVQARRIRFETIDNRVTLADRR